MPAEDDIADPANRAARANAMETRKLSGEDVSSEEKERSKEN